MVDFFDSNLSQKNKIILCVVSPFLFLIIAFSFYSLKIFSFDEITYNFIIFGLCAIIVFIFTFWITKLNIYDKFIDYFVIICIIFIALILRLSMFNFKSNDYNSFLFNWVYDFSTQGGFSAIKYNFANYNVVYLYFLAFISYFNIDWVYLIKLFSIIFDFILAIYCLKIYKLFNKNTIREISLFAAIILLPTVFLNSSIWAQCDSIYVGFAVMGLYYVMVDKSIFSMICFALSFIFKMQSIFILPIIVVLFIIKKIDLVDLIVLPTTYLISIIPAIFLNKPIIDILKVYIDQTTTYNDTLVLNAPSFYNFFSNNISQENIDSIASVGILLTIAIIMLIIYYCFKQKNHFTNEMIFQTAFLFTIIIPWCLPYMHDRYFYLAEVLSLLFAFLFVGGFYITVLVQIASLACYTAYLFGFDFFDTKYTTILMFIAIILTVRQILHKHAFKSKQLN